ncbi:5-methyltetrahydropteroyltriglutamate--homocysteine methyltransferase [Spirosoma sp. HMF4905]|uniref:5-methyltetrahydropteroyltriglutamate--homocysteine methyltransferase n=1 Tax=Spirosoma arboris TaxID=2682092 RepID=A0A7K1SPH7_9BACT|nr:cobalamin-independent methionine synthase II family protein [Spirosoma arboris]MVM35583.1 5-methyltetrahydropteroyltriglutamate--homocysteine methyltransferase [Spirosoma arboris]
MKISTELIGSIPRPVYLQQAMTAFSFGQLNVQELSELADKATKETIQELEKLGSPVLSDGEQSKPSFVTYPLQGLHNLASDGVVIPFADGHTRQLPKLTAGPFHYTTFANSYLHKAQQFSSLPIKQAVISCSAISLLYPQEGIDGYSRDQFLADLVNDAEADIRTCLNSGAYKVQIDFTEARLAIKLDPSKQLLAAFIDLNNQVLNRFSPEEKQKIGIHSCPGGDHDSTHSADIPYSELLPLLFSLEAGNFYLEYAAETDKQAVLTAIKQSLKPNQQVFLGVTNVLDPRIETAEEIRDLILEAADIIPIHQLGTTDDCGFSPFGDDTSTAREIAFAKIRARIEGTKLAENRITA